MNRLRTSSANALRASAAPLRPHLEHLISKPLSVARVHPAFVSAAAAVAAHARPTFNWRNADVQQRPAATHQRAAASTVAGVLSRPTLGSVFRAGRAQGSAARMETQRMFSVTAACAASEAPVDGVVEQAAVLVSTVDPVVLGWWPSQIIEFGIVALHNYTGAPWYMTIIGITVAVRFCLLPIAILSMRNMARLLQCKPEIERLAKRLKAQGGINAGPLAAEENKRELYALHTKHRVDMRLLFGPLIQMPFFFNFFFAVRRMAETYPSFATGGDLWFADLTITDPTYVLPAITAATMLLTLELGADTGQSLASKDANQKLFFRLMGLSVFPISIMSGFPNAIFMYWITANTFGLLQVGVMKIPGLKPALDFPVPLPPAPTVTLNDGRTVEAPAVPTAVFASKSEALSAAA
ncbi:60Kd inner membrane protein-domain-containing protein, partial [Baffinella frigidus]